MIAKTWKTIAVFLSLIICIFGSLACADAKHLTEEFAPPAFDDTPRATEADLLACYDDDDDASGTVDIDFPIYDDYAPFPDATEVDLVEKYQMSVKASIWNDFMPGSASGYTRSNNFIQISSSTQELYLPSIEISVKIVGASYNLTRNFAYYPSGSHGGDFRSTEPFHIGGEYTLYATIKILNDVLNHSQAATACSAWRECNAIDISS